MIETTAETATLKKFNESKLPQAGTEWVGKFFNELWEKARKEKIGRLGMHQRFLDLHAQYRGKKRRQSYPRVGANYIFKAIETYCATLTEKVPISELSADNADDPAMVQAFDLDNKQWWEDTEQQTLLYASTQIMQIYGTTVEKAYWDKPNNRCGIVSRDVFNCFPAPGYTMCDMNIPYFCDVDFLEEWEIRNMYGLPEEIKIPADADEQLAGTIRETTRGGKPEGTSNRHYASNYADVKGPEVSEGLKKKTLVIEIWIKDKSITSEPVIEQVPIKDALGVPIVNPDGTLMVEHVDTGEVNEFPTYPDGIRKVTICPALLKDQHVKGVLDDSINPNINWALLEARIVNLLETGIPTPVIIEETGEPAVDPATGQVVTQNQPIDEDTARQMIIERAEISYPLWGRFPYHATPSRIDTSQWWGFSIIEQLEELQGKAELMLTKYLMAYERMMFPALINPAGSGVENSEITNEPGLIIRPTAAAAQMMRYLEPPQPPREYLEVLQFLMGEIDNISMQPAVMQGQRPTGISAAAAIIALQDKASTLTSPQIRMIDSIIEWRGKALNHFKMNFDTQQRQVMVDGQPVMFRGADFFTNFKFTVESGSSAPITKAGRRQQYVELFKLNAMDLESLLTFLDIPQAKQIVERITEQTSVPGALQVLAQAGVPEEILMQVGQMAMQPQMDIQKTGGTTMPTSLPTAEQAGGYSEGMTSANNQMVELREG